MSATPSAVNSALNRRAILRAHREAVRALTQLLGESNAVVRTLYAGLADDVADILRRLAGPDGRVPASALPEFRREFNAALRRHGQAYRQLLTERLRMAGMAGALVGTGTANTAAAVYGDRALAFVRGFTGADGLRLSDRLWRIDQGARTLIGRSIEGAIASGESAYVAAQRLLREGVAVPDDLRAQMAVAQAERLQRVTLQSLLTGRGNPLYNATRVMRTEMNRAGNAALVASIGQHPDIVGVRFTLSPLHSEPDVCDAHAAANLHGLGPGVYPLDAHPYPAHPNTLSFLQPVFRDEIDADAPKQSMSDWLGAQSESVQDSVLGKAKGAAFRQGHLNDGDLLRPWYRIRSRLHRQGILGDDGG